MKARAALFSIGLAAMLSIVCLLAKPAVADEGLKSKRVPAQEPPAAQVTCEMFEIWATNGKGTTNPALSKQLVARLNQSLKQTNFELLGTTSQTLSKKTPATVKLKKGSATLQFIEVVDKSQIRLSVDFTAAKGTAHAQQKVSAADYLVVAANASSAPNTAAHVLAVSCK